MSQAELPRSGSKPYFQPGRPRTKRSWVWNQFFVLEEYMGSDPLYVGKVLFQLLCPSSQLSQL
ncbi:Cadherin-7, partial [Ophiophagus hannah]